MWRVSRTVDDKMYYENDEGERSEGFYFCGNYHDGFAIVQKKKDGPWQFRDVEGNLSEEFYYCEDYHDGFARVQKEENGPKQFRDIEGNLSEEFYFCYDYSDGFAKVQKKKDGPKQFRDVEGNLSEEFYYCGDYHGGFALVIEEKDGPHQNRDILGNVTGDKTQIGKDIYALYKGEKTVFDICEECFLDPKAINVEKLGNSKKRLTGFIPKVLQREYERWIQATGGENADINAQIKQTKQYFRECLEYCADKMEYVRKYEQIFSRKNSARKSALQEDVLTF